MRLSTHDHVARQVDFDEFAEATIDVADTDVTSLADEKYIKHFGMFGVLINLTTP